MPKNPPAFQFYPRDFLADANVAAMNLAETGAYIRLLSHCWIEGSVPGEHEALARLVGVPPSRFEKLWPALAPCFETNGHGRLTQPRLKRERDKQLRYRKEQAKHAKRRPPKGQ